MITLTANINIKSGYPISNININHNKNSISADINSITGQNNINIRNPFLLNATKFSEMASLSSANVSYYIGGVLSNENGIFNEPYIIEVTTEAATSNIVIEFDTYNNRHPHSIIFDGIEYFDDDAIFTVTNLPNYRTHTITISNWNEPNFPLVITKIYTYIDINIDRRNIIELSRDIQCKEDSEFPSYGIISNVGNMKFRDTTGEINDYAEQKLLVSELPVVINLNNTLTKRTQTVGNFLTKKWHYDNNNRTVSVSLTDGLQEWQDIIIEEINIDPRNPFAILINGTMSDLYYWLYTRTPRKFNMLQYTELNEKTIAILQNTKISYPLLYTDNLWAQWNKLCQVCGLYIYINDTGRTICSYDYGS